MKEILAIFQKELQTSYYSLIAYIVIGLFTAIAGYSPAPNPITLARASMITLLQLPVPRSTPRYHSVFFLVFIIQNYIRIPTHEIVIVKH